MNDYEKVMIGLCSAIAAVEIVILVIWIWVIF